MVTGFIRLNGMTVGAVANRSKVYDENAEVVEEFGCEVVQYDWAPPAGGNVKLIKTLNFLRNYEGIEEKNREVIAKVVASQPVLKDNVRAKEVIPEFAENNGK